ncbi:FadR/GntR family transcriptional regulator [Dactylosporangium sp. CS-033363]|uniref:FadR/GntR family transcriptional regulator n=1 Tax=Dactylosporangium sp. CS-033363 TaxID=3239935 RepID=UPI003D8F2801
MRLDRDRRPPKASVMVAAQLRAQILGHGLTPGSPLPSEAQLINDTGLGRATIREALRLLEAEGLIAIKRGPQGGVTVRRPDLSGLSRSLAPFLTLSEAPLRDLFVFRKAVEPQAASLAAANASDAQRERLLQLAGHDPHAGYANEIAFHQLVAECAGNELMRVLLVVPYDLLRLHLDVEDISSDDVSEANGAHAAIAKFIAAGDEPRAGRAMLKHLESFEDMMQRHNRLDQPIVPRERWLRDPGTLQAAFFGDYGDD